MIETIEDFTTAPATLWPIISDPRRWPDWVAIDGPWLPPESVMPIAADGSEWLATAADGQQATWQIATDNDGHRLQCMTTDTKQAAVAVRLLHTLQIIPIEADTPACRLLWATEYDLVRFGFWQRLIMRGPVREAIETMQVYSIINLHDMLAAPIDEDEPAE